MVMVTVHVIVLWVKIIWLSDKRWVLTGLEVRKKYTRLGTYDQNLRVIVYNELEVYICNYMFSTHIHAF